MYSHLAPVVVVPSSMRFYTPLVPTLMAKNPDLAKQVIHLLNQVDRSRNTLFRQVIGDLKVKNG